MGINEDPENPVGLGRETKKAMDKAGSNHLLKKHVWLEIWGLWFMRCDKNAKFKFSDYQKRIGRKNKNKTIHVH